MEFKHTPAPWRWELNEKSKNINLAGGIPRFDLIVMSFTRYGTNSASPEFRNENCIMQRSEKYGEIVKGREHHADWFKSISHPDALLIQNSPEMLEMLIELMNNKSFTSHLPTSALKVQQLIKKATTI